MKRRCDHARRNRIDADLLADQFLGVAPRDRGDKTLGGGVEHCAASAAVPRRDRSCVDDEPALALEPGNCGPGHPDDRARIQIDHRPEVLVAGLKRVNSAEHQAGIVDEAIEAAEPGRRFGDDLHARFRVGDIAFNRERFAAGHLDLARKRVSLVRARIVTDGDARPLLGEAPRHRGPYAGRAAGDEHGFAGEIGNDEAGSGHEQAFLLLGTAPKRAGGGGRVKSGTPPRPRRPKAPAPRRPHPG